MRALANHSVVNDSCTANPPVIQSPCALQTRISVAEARQLVLDDVEPLACEQVPRPRALGRTLRMPVCAAEDLPPFDNAAMDGFAVRCADLPARLPVVETIFAGQWPHKVVEVNTCSAIMTGAPMPPGADAVVPVEWTTRIAPDLVQIARVPEHGMYVRHSGQDARKGAVLVSSGVVVTAFGVGMIASAGVQEVVVSQRPRVAVISTGDEVFAGRGPLPEGKIRDINGAALTAQVTDAGGVAIGPFYARDNEYSVVQTITKALEASDVLLVAGGVSVGEHDLVKDALDTLGIEMCFWRVRQRPGGPLAFGRLQGRAVFGLPGNPVSAAVCFEQYVRPLLATMLGNRQIHRPRLSAILSAPTPKKKGLHFFTRGIYRYGADGRLMVRDTGPQASNLYSSLAQANCFIHLEESVASAPAGMCVFIEPLTGRAA